MTKSVKLDAHGVECMDWDIVRLSGNLYQLHPASSWEEEEERMTRYAEVVARCSGPHGFESARALQVLESFLLLRYGRPVVLDWTQITPSRLPEQLARCRDTGQPIRQGDMVRKWDWEAESIRVMTRSGEWLVGEGGDVDIRVKHAVRVEPVVSQVPAPLNWVEIVRDANTRELEMLLEGIGTCRIGADSDDEVREQLLRHYWSRCAEPAATFLVELTRATRRSLPYPDSDRDSSGRKKSRRRASSLRKAK